MKRNVKTIVVQTPGDISYLHRIRDFIAGIASEVGIDQHDIDNIEFDCAIITSTTKTTTTITTVITSTTTTVSCGPYTDPFWQEFTPKFVEPPITDGTAPPTSDGSAITIDIDYTNVLRCIPETLMGNNAAVWNGDYLLTPTSKSRLSTVNISLLRFPGGSTADKYHWDDNYPVFGRMHIT